MSDADRQPAVRARFGADVEHAADDDAPWRRTGPFVPAATRVWIFSLGLALLAILLEVGVVQGRALAPPPLTIPWPLIAAGFCLAEIKVVPVSFRREQHSFSLSEFPAVIGLFLLSPTDYLLALLVGSGLALAWARQAPLKLAEIRSHGDRDEATELEHLGKLLELRRTARQGDRGGDAQRR